MSALGSSLSSNILGQGLQIQIPSEPTRSFKWNQAVGDPGQTIFLYGAEDGELDGESRAVKYFIIQEKLDMWCV